MALPADLRAVDEAYREQHAAQAERLFDVPAAEPLPESRPVVWPADWVPPGASEGAWMNPARDGRWCVSYRYVGNRKYDRAMHRAASPADLARFMRDRFKGSAFVEVVRVWEDVSV